MVETLCTSGSVKNKAGANVSTTTTNDPTIMTRFINQAEGQFIADTGVNWINIYSTMDADFKQAIERAVSAFAAIDVINYDQEAVGTNQAINRINVLLDQYERGVRAMKEAKIYKGFGGSAITT